MSRFPNFGRIIDSVSGHHRHRGIELGRDPVSTVSTSHLPATEEGVSRTPVTDPVNVSGTVEAILKGDIEQFDRLWLHFFPEMMKHLVWRQHYRRSEAEDCLQDTLLLTRKKLLSSTLKAYDPNLKLTPFWMQALAFACQEHMSHCVPAQVNQATLQTELTEDVLTARDEVPNAEERLVRKEECMAARTTVIALQEHLFAELMELEYAVYVLYYRDELKSSDISQLLKMTRRQVDAIREKIIRKAADFRRSNV